MFRFWTSATWIEICEDWIWHIIFWQSNQGSSCQVCGYSLCYWRNYGAFDWILYYQCSGDSLLYSQNYHQLFEKIQSYFWRKITLELTSIYFNVLCSLKCIYFKILLSLCCRNGLHSNILHSYTWNFFWNTLYHVRSAYSVLCQH